MLRAATFALVLCFWAAPGRADDAPPVVTVELRDGSRLVGRVVSEDADTLRVETAGGLVVDVPRAEIVRRTAFGGERARGVDPNYSRMMFAPTARPLRKGDGYFSDYELFFPGVAYGVTDNLSLSGGVSMIPGLGIDEQLFYVAPKLGFELSPRAALAVGGLWAASGEIDSFGIGYAMGTFGPAHRSFSIGAGVAATDDDTALLLAFGGNWTVSRNMALVGESWLDLRDPDVASQPFGVAVRFFGDRLSADVGVILTRELIEEGFPLPWVSVSYHFGRQPQASSARTSSVGNPRPNTRSSSSSAWRLRAGRT